ncbi:MAG TPA: PAS domain S-box protein [Candidatus Angelobacter sp.]|nr:PAS domain S-box protein [Candidatus Angelobacter sp.]
MFLTGFMTFFNWKSTRRAEEDADWVVHTHSVQRTLQGAVGHAVDTETGARGFAVTGQGVFLEPYQNGQRALTRDLDTLRTLTADNGNQQKRLDLLRSQVNASLESSGKMVDGRQRTGVIPVDTEFVEGKRRMDAVRATVAEMQSEEAKLLDERLGRTQEARRQTGIIVFSSALFGMALLVLAGLTILREINHSFRMREQLRILNADLEQRSAESRRAEEEARRAEESSKRSESRLNLALDAAQMGIWELDLLNDTAIRNLRHDQIFGYKSLQPEWGSEIFLTHVVPEDRDGVRKRFEKANSTDSLYFECRIAWADQSVHWISAQGKVLRDDTGKPVRMTGTVADITERKRVEEALRIAETRRQSEAQFRTLANAIPQLCWMAQPDGWIFWYNDRWYQYTGTTPAQMEGWGWQSVHDPETLPKVLEQWKGSIATGKPFDMVFPLRGSDGLFRPFLTRVMPVHDQDGKVSGWFGTNTDISEQRRTEEELRHVSEQRRLALAELQQLNDELDQRVAERTAQLARSNAELNEAQRIGKLASWQLMTKSKTAIWSEAVYRIFGVDPGCPPLSYEEQSRIFTKESWERLLAAIDHAATSGTPYELDLEFRHSDGTQRWITTRGECVQDAGGKEAMIRGTIQDITERKQVEHKLSEQAALLNLAADAILVRDLKDKVTFWSRGATETYGWSPDEAQGQVTHELLQTRFPVPLKEIATELETQGQWEGELEHTSRDGKTIIAASRWSLLRNERGVPSAVLEINRDITRRKQAEEQLRILTERLSLATRTASIGIWDWDLRSNLTVWDDTTFEIVGIPKVVPMAYEEFARRIHPDDMAALNASLQRVIQGKTQDFVEFRIIRPDGSVRHLSSAEGAVLDEHGNVVRVVGTAVDVTARKEMEAQIEASREQMMVSARLSALGMMAGGVAHEINNPLAIIHASAADLLSSVQKEGSVPLAIAKRNSERILETANRITRIIKSMRHLAREGSHDRVLPASVAKIVQETLEVCEERFKYHSINLLLPKIDPALMVSCREVQIGQVLLNLLQNAFDAVVEQPGERWIRLDVTLHDGSVVFSVIDNGPGIPPELKTKIMEPFFTTKEVGKGTGLGLSLSRTIVEEHGGTLELTESAGHPCFSFHIPLARKEEPVCN